MKDAKYSALAILLVGALGTLVRAAAPAAPPLDLIGAWRLTSYVKADTQVRYRTEGYMLFSRSHWTHLAYFNRDPRDRDFAEAHHGTYRITGPDTLILEADMEFHMDPKMEFQKTPVWYGPAATIRSTYKVEGSTVVMDFASGAQVVIDRIE
jgi:hypothetical protein